MAVSGIEMTATGRVSPAARIRGALRGALDGMMRSNARMRQYEALSALSDSQLAARGLSRETLPAFVFAASDWA